MIPKVLSDLAEEFWGHSEIGSNLRLRDPLVDVWVMLNECLIPFQGRLGEVVDDPPLVGYEGLGEHHPEHPFKFWNPNVQLLECTLLDLKNLGFFQHIDVQHRRFAIHQAVKV